MISGIYRFDFSDGSYYIGKSENIENRWKTHIREMESGRHTKAIQATYNSCGLPQFSIIRLCHKHHIDILESYYINLHWSNDILNSTRPNVLSIEETELVDRVPYAAWDLSTFEHYMQWSDVTTERDKLKDELARVKDGTALQELEKELWVTKSLLNESNAKVTELINRGFWDRVFNRI